VFAASGLAVSLFALVSYAEHRLIRWKKAEVH
jgi:hypothetical protein